MESYEASRAVFTRVQNIDPENASKIMGYVLLHYCETDIIHLAYGPETMILSLVNKAKNDLGLSSNTLCAQPQPPLSTKVSNPISISRPTPLTISGFSSPNSPSIWSPHHASVSPSNNDFQVNINSNNKDHNFVKNVEFNNEDLCMSPLSYLDEIGSSSSGGEAKSNNLYHRRSSSLNDYYFRNDDLSLGFGVANNNSKGLGVGVGVGVGVGGMYHNRGFSDDTFDVDFEQEKIFRSKIAQQHRLAAQLMATGVSLPYNKLNFLNAEAQRSAAALMMSDDLHKVNRLRMARFGGIDCDPSSRQIYLTFPADSTFKEEDVSNYFNKYGPVQDVRIPYQAKRMFGFVTFVFPETVKIILAKGNPHFVCDSRVLVKPYKEKSKLPDKKHYHHQFERGDFSCSSPSDHVFREPYDFQPGGRMMLSPQEMLMRKKLEEQAELQHALELQERRLMNLQLLSMKNQQQHNVSVGSPVSSPNMFFQESTIQTTLSPSHSISQEAEDVTEENKASPTLVDDELNAEEVNTGVIGSNVSIPEKESCSPNPEEELSKSLKALEHALPDNLFTSPAKASDIPPATAKLDNGTKP